MVDIERKSLDVGFANENQHEILYHRQERSSREEDRASKGINRIVIIEIQLFGEKKGLDVT